MQRKYVLTALLVFSLVLLPVQALATSHGEAPSGFYTPETLQEFDGEGDTPAYVAYNGRVYDLTETFEEGTHAGHEAGQNLTEALNEAEHGTSVLDDVEAIGYYLIQGMTADELDNYDGEGDSPAYVAVNNIIYDGSDLFEDGTHAGHEAGQDLTEAFQDQHEAAYIERLPVVGALVTYKLTEEELAEYDGQDGQPAFVAVDGFIYDVTERFEDGSHGGNEAGQVLTEAVAESGHMRSVLPDYPVVGMLVE